MRLLPIQVLRAAAALSVAVHHALHEASSGTVGAGSSLVPSRLLPWDAGVDVFFVISGFVMVYASRRMFAAPGARRAFLARRVARVVPLYWVLTAAYLGIALSAPALLNGGPPSGPYVLSSLLFWPMARPDGLVQPLYSLGWTLNYEMAFYGLFALALGLPRPRAVPALCLALLGITAIGSLGHWPLPFGFWADPIILEFAAGLLLGQARLEGVRLGVVPRAALTLSAILLLAAVAEPGSLAGWERAAFWGGPAACLVAACGLGRDDLWHRPSGLALWLDRAGASLGDASYALYLVHPFAIRGTREVLRVAGLAIPPAALVALGIAATVVAALAVHRWIERPLTRAARRVLDPAGPEPLVAQAGLANRPPPTSREPP